MVSTLGLQGCLVTPLTEELIQQLFGVSIVKEFIRDTYDSYFSMGSISSIVYYTFGGRMDEGQLDTPYLSDVMLLRYNQNIIRVEIDFKVDELGKGIVTDEQGILLTE